MNQLTIATFLKTWAAGEAAYVNKLKSEISPTNVIVSIRCVSADCWIISCLGKPDYLENSPEIIRKCERYIAHANQLSKKTQDISYLANTVLFRPPVPVWIWEQLPSSLQADTRVCYPPPMEKPSPYIQEILDMINSQPALDILGVY